MPNRAKRWPNRAEPCRTVPKHPELCAELCSIMPNHSVPCRTMPNHGRTMPNYTEPCRTAPNRAEPWLYHAEPCRAVPNHAELRAEPCATIHFTVLPNAASYHTLVILNAMQECPALKVALVARPAERYVQPRLQPAIFTGREGRQCLRSAGVSGWIVEACEQSFRVDGPQPVAERLGLADQVRCRPLHPSLLSRQGTIASSKASSCRLTYCMRVGGKTCLHLVFRRLAVDRGG